MVRSESLAPDPVDTRAPALTFTALVEAHARAVLTLYTCIYAIGACLAASRKPFWFDEIFTCWEAEFPHIGLIWTAIKNNSEGTPPLLFWLSWIIHWLTGGGHVVMRLPAMVGFWVMSVCLYLFVRRRTNPAYGFIALVVPLFTFAAGYAIEARAYGLTLGFAGISLVCWQCATEGIRRRIALAGIVLGVAGAVSSHYYATYLVIALLSGELVRAHVRRRVDWPCLIAIVAGALPLLGFWPLIAVEAGLARTFWAPSSIQGVVWCYFQMLTPAFVLGLPLLVYILIRKPQTDADRKRAGHQLPAWEACAAAVLLAMPLVLFIAGLFVPVGLWDKYVILAVLGLAIMLPSALYQLTNGSAAPAEFVLKLAFFFCFVPWAIFRGYALYLQPSPAELVQKQTVVPQIRGLKVVTTNEVPFLQQYFYAPVNRKQQMCVLLNPAAAAQFQGDDTAQRCLIALLHFRPVPAYEYRSFIASNPEFVLVRTEGPDWLTPKLLSDGAALELIEHEAKPGRFQPKTEIFLVHTRESADSAHVQSPN